MAANSFTSSSDEGAAGQNGPESADEREPSRWLRQIPWGLLGALVIGVAVEGAVERNRLSIAGPEHWDWIAGRDACGKDARKYRAFCFGSSVGHNAMAAKVIEQRTGWRAYNLAVCWGQAAGYYFQLRRVLEAGAKPKALIVEFHPACLTEDHWNMKRLWPELLGSRDIVDLAWSVRDPEFMVQMLLARNVPTIQYRLQLREGICDAINQTVRPEGARNKPRNRLYRRNRDQNQGSIVLAKTPSYHGEVASHYEHMLLPAEWKRLPYQVSYVRKFLELARRRNIAVYWLMPPFAPELQTRRERCGLDARYTRFACTLVELYPNLRVLDARSSGYDATVFYDASHLDRDGAATLSTDVGDSIRIVTNEVAHQQDRWVTLPAFRAVRPAVRMEDLGESMLALAKRTRGNRQ